MRESDEELTHAIRQLGLDIQTARDEDPGEEFTLKFKDKNQAMLAMRAMEMYSELYNIDQMCRSTLKHRESENEELDTFAEEIREAIWGTGLMNMEL